MIDPGPIFEGISALAEVISLSLELRKGKSAYYDHPLPPMVSRPPGPGERMGPLTYPEPDPNKFGKHQAPQPRFREKIIDGASALQHLSDVDNELLIIVLKNIRDAKTRLASAWGDPTNNNQDKNRELTIAQCAICSELKRLFKLHGGKKLPAPIFEELWVQNSCAPAVVS